VSVSTPVILALDNSPVSKTLDLTLEPILSLLKTSRTILNQSKDQCNKGYKSPNTKPKLLSPKTKSPTRGQWPIEESKDAPKRAKKNATEGEILLMSE